MLSIVGHFVCLFTLKRRFFVAEVAEAELAEAEPEKSHHPSGHITRILNKLMFRCWPMSKRPQMGKD